MIHITYPDGWEQMPATLHDALAMWRMLKAQHRDEQEKAAKQRKH